MLLIKLVVIKRVKVMRWFFKNINWLFDGVLTTIVSRFLNNKSAQKNETNQVKNIKIKGKNHNVTINQNRKIVVNNRTIIKKGDVINYDKGVNVTLGASGSAYIAPSNGVFYIKGLEGIFCIRNKVEGKITPEGTQIHVENKDIITINYNHPEKNIEFKFYYAKGVRG